MAMNGAALAAALQPVIVSQIEGEFGAPADSVELGKFATAMANAIGETVVSYIQANAQVTTSDAQGGTNTGTVS